VEVSWSLGSFTCSYRRFLGAALAGAATRGRTNLVPQPRRIRAWMMTGFGSTTCADSRAGPTRATRQDGELPSGRPRALTPADQGRPAGAP
jgi:hypothetical protein